MNWRRVLYGLGLTIGLALFARQAWLGYGALRNNSHITAHLGYLLAALSCYLAGNLVQIAAWAMVMRAVGAPLQVDQALRGYILAFLPRYIPGTVWGYLSRGEWLARECGVAYSISSLASLLEAATLLLTALSIGALWYVAVPWRLPVALICFILLWINWHWLPRLLQHIAPARWQHQLQTSHSPWLGVGGNLLYILFWAVHGCGLWLLGRALGFWSGAPPWSAISAASVAWAAGFVVLFVPTGLGVREATLTALLQQQVGLLAGEAGTLAVLSRLWIILAELLLLLMGVVLQARQWFQQQRFPKQTKTTTKGRKGEL
jgi:glycosyltransferase 2 family protein